MKVLCTGGAGFIGSHIVKVLLKAGEQVRVFDNFSRGKQSSVPLEAEVAEGNICNSQAVHNAMRGIDEVIHMAYINGTQNFYERPREVLDVGVRGMLNVLDACRDNGVKNFMLVSSSEVCRAEVGKMDEDAPFVIPEPYNPRFSYAAGKMLSEIMLIHSGLFEWAAIVRPFNIYGPGMPEGHVIPDFKKKIEAGEFPLAIIGDGTETRSFCYIDDFVDGFMIVRKDGGHNGIHNIGNPQEEVEIGYLAKLMMKICGVPLEKQTFSHLPAREGSIYRRQPDITKMEKLGYKPKVSLDEGLRRMLCQ